MDVDYARSIDGRLDVDGQESRNYDHGGANYSNDRGAHDHDDEGFGQFGGLVMTTAPVFECSRGLGCSVVVGVTAPELLLVACERAEAEIAACDLACSRFRADSELSALNDPIRQSTEVAVSPWLADALATAIRAAAETDGLVDPTVGQCIIDFGYDRSFEFLSPDQPLVVTAQHVAAWERVRVWGLRATVPVGVRLDLGATAKALCADQAARAAATLAGCGVLVSLGGDIAVSGPAPEEGWAVYVTDRSVTAPGAGSNGQMVAIREGGLATSGTTARRWVQGGRARHHLVDPRTAEPAAEVWRTVSVAAPSCVEANVASTAGVILGEEAPRWFSQRGVHARLVAADGEVVLVGDWPPDDMAGTAVNLTLGQDPGTARVGGAAAA